MTRKNHFDKPATLDERKATQKQLRDLLWDAENKLRKAVDVMFLNGLTGTDTDDATKEALKLLEDAMHFSPWTGEDRGLCTPLNYDRVWYGVIE